MAESEVNPERSAIGQRLIDDLRGRGIECYAAFWAIVPTDGSLRLYLVTPAVDSQGPRQLLRHTDQILRRLNGHAGVELFDIEFQSPSDPSVVLLASSFDITVPGNRL